MSSTIAFISSAVFEKLLYPFNLVTNGTKCIATVYEAVYSTPLSYLRENIVYISIGLYMLWYIKAYLSVILLNINKKWLITFVIAFFPKAN